MFSLDTFKIRVFVFSTAWIQQSFVQQIKYDQVFQENSAIVRMPIETKWFTSCKEHLDSRKQMPLQALSWKLVFSLTD